MSLMKVLTSVSPIVVVTGLGADRLPLTFSPKPGWSFGGLSCNAEYVLQYHLDRFILLTEADYRSLHCLTRLIDRLKSEGKDAQVAHLIGHRDALVAASHAFCIAELEMVEVRDKVWNALFNFSTPD